MKKTVLNTICAALVTLPATGWAQEAPLYEAHPELGYIGCFDTKPTIWGADLEQAMRMAEIEGAYGFLHWPERTFTAMMPGPYPDDCKSSPDSDWHVYLATDAMVFYKKANHGVDGCDLDVIQEITNTDQADSFAAARKFEAAGFVVDHANGTALLLATAPDASCAAPSDPARELYLAAK